MKEVDFRGIRFWVEDDGEEIFLESTDADGRVHLVYVTDLLQLVHVKSVTDGSFHNAYDKIVDMALTGMTDG